MAGLLRQFFTNLKHLPSLNVINFELRTCRLSSNHIYNSNSIGKRFLSSVPTPYEIVDVQEQKRTNQDVFDKVNKMVANQQCGRLFAVVHLAGKQWKITEGDVIVVEGYWPPDAGDRIRFNKVMLIGGVDFTLIGRPLIQNDLTEIDATVIEKTLSHTKTHFRKKRRKQYMRTHFYRIPQTWLRINRIEMVGQVNQPPEVSEGTSRTF